MSTIHQRRASKERFWRTRVRRWHSSGLSVRAFCEEHGLAEVVQPWARIAKDYALMPANMNHFAYTAGETTIILYGQGPVDFKYVNPADDPRNAKAATK